MSNTKSHLMINHFDGFLYYKFVRQLAEFKLTVLAATYFRPKGTIIGSTRLNPALEQSSVRGMLL